MSNRAILSSKNITVNRINELACKYFPGVSRIYYSIDSCVNDYQVNTYPTEFLNKITDSSLPLHKLELKLNQPI
jgi:hypothetical protein